MRAIDSDGVERIDVRVSVVQLEHANAGNPMAIANLIGGCNWWAAKPENQRANVSRLGSVTGSGSTEARPGAARVVYTAAFTPDRSGLCNVSAAERPGGFRNVRIGFGDAPGSFATASESAGAALVSVSVEAGRTYYGSAMINADTGADSLSLTFGVPA